MDSQGGPRFPLEPEKRPKLSVDRETVNWWKQQARQEVAALMQDKKSWYYKGLDSKEHQTLRLAFNKHDIRGYTDKSAAGTAARRTLYFCHGVLNLSLEDIAYALYCDATPDQRTVATQLYQDSFLDTAVLDVYERRSVEDPFHFAGAKWLAYRIPPGLVASPDMIYFEYSCKTRDAGGNVVLVQYTMCPELAADQVDEQNVGLARAHASQISTFRFLDEGTHCQSSGWFEASANVPDWVATKSVQQIFSNMGHLVGLADARAIASLGTAAAVSTSKACYLCSKKFGMMHKKHNCRSCGQSICTKCTIKLKVLRSLSPQQRLSHSHSSSPSSSSSSNSNNSAPKFVEDKFCLPCVLQAREQRPESGSFSEVVGSLSSEESSATAPPSIDEDYDMDLSDLHDDGANDLSDLDNLEDTYLFDRHGRSAHKTLSDHLDNSKIVSASSRRKPVSPVEEYLSRARNAGNSRNATHKKRATSHPPDGIGPLARGAVADERRETPTTRAIREPVHSQPGPAQRLPAAFNKLSQSIAAQEALLQTIQQERSKFHARQQQQSERRRADSEESDFVGESGRFEVISEELY